MKSIIIYDSLTGNTKKIADVFAKNLKCESTHINKIEKYKIEKYDLVIIGSPVHGGIPTKKIRDLLKKNKIKKLYVIFCTYGLPLIGKFLADSCLKYIKKKINAKCIGKFKCPGFHQILRTYKERPNKKDLESAKEFIERLLKKI